jgi:hypothetical protein
VSDEEREELSDESTEEEAPAPDPSGATDDDPRHPDRDPLSGY